LVRWFVRDVLSVYFPRVFLTNEDKRRTDQYRANAERKKFAEAPDMTDFIKDLHIRLKVYVNDKTLLERTAQMTQKTNQFNLTTRRYGRNEVECFMNSPDWYVFNLEYEDKFGGEGIIAVGIIKVMHGSAFIDSFLMSCRVIGRGIEYTFLDTITKSVREKHTDIVEILAEYMPTKKNGIVSDFYEKAGFNVQGRETDGRKRYRKDLPADLPSRAVGD
jgi:FkbH-like protein